MKIFHGVAELTASVGTHLGHSNWIDVDQARVNMFADATDDHQWIHIDPERAVQGPFGSTIAHGYLTLSLMSEMMWQAYRVDGLAMQINYGCNKVRFPAPVPVPSRLRAGVELASVEPFRDGYLSTVVVAVEREGGSKPVCVAEILTYLMPVTAIDEDVTQPEVEIANE